jgi:membrane protein DedA with SNARE-associated domain
MPVPVHSVRFLVLSAACFVAAWLAMGMGLLKIKSTPAELARLHRLEIAVPAVFTVAGVGLLAWHLRRARVHRR